MLTVKQIEAAKPKEKPYRLAVVQLHFTSPQSQLLFGSRISAGQSHQC